MTREGENLMSEMSFVPHHQDHGPSLFSLSSLAFVLNSKTESLINHAPADRRLQRTQLLHCKRIVITNFNQLISMPLSSLMASNQGHSEEDPLTEERITCMDLQHDVPIQLALTPRAIHTKSSVASETEMPTPHIAQESVAKVEDSDFGEDSFTQDLDTDKSSFTSIHDVPQSDCSDNDEDFIANTCDQTSKDQVIQLKLDLIAERDRARKERREFAEYKSSHEERIWRWTCESNARLQKETRGKPRPPRLGSKSRWPLYDNLADRLRECTVFVLLNRARDNHAVGDYQLSELHAERARVKYASTLDYEPLSAWCQFHVGKTQFAQKRYNEALSSFDQAGPAIGLYVQGEVVDSWIRKIIEADGQDIRRRGTDSTESAPMGKSLADELAGRGDSGSSSEFS